MGFDLKPRNSKAGDISFSVFSWPIILAEVGGVIGYRQQKDFSFTYIPDAKDRCPAYNDGFYVNAEQARAIAACCESIISQAQFNGNNDPEPGLTKLARELMPFARASGGFWIY